GRSRRAVAPRSRPAARGWRGRSPPGGGWPCGSPPAPSGFRDRPRGPPSRPVWPPGTLRCCRGRRPWPGVPEVFRRRSRLRPCRADEKLDRLQAPQRLNLCPENGKSNGGRGIRRRQEAWRGAAEVAFFRASLSIGRSLKPGLISSTLENASVAVLTSFLLDRATMPRLSQVCQCFGSYDREVRNCAIAS